MKKFFLYSFITAFVVLSLSALILHIPFFQDRIFENLSKYRLLSALEWDLEEDALQVTVCGSGSPVATPGRAQSCLLVQTPNDMYIFDIGDGSVTNLINWGVPLERLKAVFITHLHSDHFADLGDLRLVSWIGRDRVEKVKLFGPEGIQQVAVGFEMAFKFDQEYRIAHHGVDLAPPNSVGFITKATREGEIFSEKDLTVSAFRVDHEPVDPAFGYRINYKDRSIVISGDTLLSDNLISFSKGVDVMFHEALSKEMTSIISENSKDIYDEYGIQMAKLGAPVFIDIQDYHASPIDAAIAARDSGAGLLVYYHLVPSPSEPIKPIMEKIFFRGVDNYFTNWISSNDGTKIILPVGSKEIEVLN